MITSVPPIILRSCRGCGLGELAGLRVLFLREQVRDLWVREFLRELIVGVAAPSDLVGSFIVKILHCAEGGDVSKWLEHRNNSLVFVIAHLSLNSLVFISYLLLLFTSLYA